jgi:hypothetical protein
MFDNLSLCVFLFGVTQYNYILLKSSSFTNESSISCLDIDNDFA